MMRAGKVGVIQVSFWKKLEIQLFLVRSVRSKILRKLERMAVVKIEMSGKESQRLCRTFREREQHMMTQSVLGFFYFNVLISVHLKRQEEH